MPAANEPSDAPRLATSDDELTIRESLSPDASRAERAQQPSTDINTRIRAAIARMSGQGPDAEAEYQAALRTLLKDPGAAAAVATAYRRTPEDQYVERWAHVHLLSELRQTEALVALDEIVATPIPPEKEPGMILHSTVGEEAMIRTTAIEGITRLAAAGERQAADVLARHTRHENLSVRRAAVQGYIEALGPEAREELRQRLPESDRFLVDIRRTNVQDVPQPTVERAAEAKDAVSPPAPVPHSRLQPRIEE